MPTGPSASPTSPGSRGEPSRVSAVRIWVMAARVRTLPAAVAPVLVGTSLALGAGHFRPLAFVAALFLRETPLRGAREPVLEEL